MISQQMDGFGQDVALVGSGQLCRLLGISSSSLWRLIQNDPSFPAALRLQPGNQRARLKWRVSEIAKFLQSKQVASKTAEPFGLMPGERVTK